MQHLQRILVGGPSQHMSCSFLLPFLLLDVAVGIKLNECIKLTPQQWVIHSKYPPDLKTCPSHSTHNPSAQGNMTDTISLHAHYIYFYVL